MREVVFDIITRDRNWTDKDIEKYKRVFNKITKETFDHLKIKIKPNQHVELTLSLVEDNEIQKLNSEYRKKDKPTGVLSFSMFKRGKFVKELEKYSHLSLGEIFLSIKSIEKQAEEREVSVRDHIIHLFLHSLLHLLGYEHGTTYKANKMEGIEVEILKKFGVRNPY